MTAIPLLVQRLDHVDAVLRTVRKLERAQRNAQRASPDSVRAVASIRAGAYVMTYNAVEATVRTTLGSLRSKIQQEAVSFADANDFWRLDYIQASFLDRMQSGTNHGNVLVDLIPMSNAPLRWENTKIGRLPLSGNFGQEAAIALKVKLPLHWQAPTASGGGADLEIIRARRNDLSHGLEAYDVVGGATTTPDMFDLVSRTRIFMVSFVEALERYQAARGYLR